MTERREDNLTTPTCECEAVGRRTKERVSKLLQQLHIRDEQNPKLRLVIADVTIDSMHIAVAPNVYEELLNFEVNGIGSNTVVGC